MSCKDSHHVVRINPDRPADHSIFPCDPRPIFVAVHPQSRDVYATLDQSSAIFRVIRSGPPKQQGETVTIPVPPERGSTPVGMIPGPDGSVWFVLLGGANGGQGRFGRITADAQIHWFQINSGAAMGASLIAPRVEPDAQAPAHGRILLLGSSMASMMALNAVFDVGLSEGYTKIETQQTIAFPSQHSMSHRVLTTRHGLYATELGACEWCTSPRRIRRMGRGSMRCRIRMRSGGARCRRGGSIIDSMADLGSNLGSSKPLAGRQPPGREKGSSLNSPFLAP